MERGFITVATGARFYQLAINLAKSYRTNCKNIYPFAVITDKKGEEMLSKHFDRVIIMDNPHYSYLDKLAIIYNTPYEETIFIDADIDIVDDISFLFSAFEKNGSDISCLGSLKPNDGKDKPYMWNDIAIKKYNLTHFMSFNGGIYYFKKTERAILCINRIFEELLPNYDNLQLKLFRGTLKADEPLYGLSMMISGFYPVNYGFDIAGMHTHKDNLKSLKWNIKRKNCSIYCWNRWVSPKFIHWGFSLTKSFKYKYYNAMLNDYRFIKKAIIAVYILFSHFAYILKSNSIRVIKKGKRLFQTID